jgi:hypothetical protein
MLRAFTVGALVWLALLPHCANAGTITGAVFQNDTIIFSPTLIFNLVNQVNAVNSSVVIVINIGSIIVDPAVDTTNGINPLCTNQPNRGAPLTGACAGTETVTMNGTQTTITDVPSAPFTPYSLSTIASAGSAHFGDSICSTDSMGNLQCGMNTNPGQLQEHKGNMGDFITERNNDSTSPNFGKTATVNLGNAGLVVNTSNTNQFLVVRAVFQTQVLGQPVPLVEYFEVPAGSAANTTFAFENLFGSTLMFDTAADCASMPASPTTACVSEAFSPTQQPMAMLNDSTFSMTGLTLTPTTGQFVPEPSTLLLLLGGVTCLVGYEARRRRYRG